MFLERATKRWWTLVIRGLLAIAFGILAIRVPGAAVMTLVIIFGVYAIAEGLASLSMFLSPVAEGSGWIGFSGVLSIAAGVIALIWPGITAVALFYVIAFWAIILGIIELVAAVRYSSALENEWAYALSGLLWIAFGVIVIGWPRMGVVAMLALIATAAILRGVMLIVAGVRLRRAHQVLTSGGHVAHGEIRHSDVSRRNFPGE
jgi:uncharacterized membrane protein HdeD (DUF308 family)